MLQRSNDAIVQVQEGIVVDANPAWVELFGVGRRCSASRSWICSTSPPRRPCKGALAACLQGRWSDHTLKVNAILADGSPLPVEVVLALGEHEGEPSVRLVAARPSQHDDAKLAEDLTEAVRSDATTGFLHRRELLEALDARGSRAPARRRHALRRLDQARQVRDRRARRRRHRSEDVLVEFAKLVKETLHPKEIVGRLGGVRFLALLERGNEHDVEAWGEQLIARRAEARHPHQGQDRHR